MSYLRFIVLQLGNILPHTLFHSSSTRFTTSGDMRMTSKKWPREGFTRPRPFGGSYRSPSWKVTKTRVRASTGIPLTVMGR
jgi:hypothetical protein